MQNSDLGGADLTLHKQDPECLFQAHVWTVISSSVFLLQQVGNRTSSGVEEGDRKIFFIVVPRKAPHSPYEGKSFV